MWTGRLDRCAVFMDALFTFVDRQREPVRFLTGAHGLSISPGGRPASWYNVVVTQTEQRRNGPPVLPLRIVSPMTQSLAGFAESRCTKYSVVCTTCHRTRPPTQVSVAPLKLDWAPLQMIVDDRKNLIRMHSAALAQIVRKEKCPRHISSARLFVTLSEGPLRPSRDPDWTHPSRPWANSC